MISYAALPIAVTPELLLVVIVLALGWLWLDSMKVRETALAAAREACGIDGLMLLDETVAVTAMKLVRDEDGRVKLQRRYEFEYSDTGNDRHKGNVVLVGRRVVLFNIGVRDPVRPHAIQDRT